MENDVLCRIECYLRELLEQGYGDPLDSLTGDSPVLGADFVLICTASRASVLILENTGLILVEWAMQQNVTKGKTIPAATATAAGGVITIDRFRGSLYARGTGGVLNFALLPWNRPIR